MKHSPWTCVFALLMFFVPTACFANDPLEGLVKKLGDDSWRVRELASETLKKSGPKALPFLRKGLLSPELEVRIRSRRAIAFIRAKEVLKPRVYSYSASKKQVSVILKELSTLSGEAVYISPGDFPKDFYYRDSLAKDRIISIEAKEKSIWEILNDICVKTDARVESLWVNGSRRYCLIQQKEGDKNPCAAAGPLYGTMTNSYFSSENGTPSYGLQLTLHCEQKRPVLYGSCTVKVLKAVTDKGETLKSFPQNYYYYSRDCSTIQDVYASIARPSAQKESYLLSELKVEVSYCLLGEYTSTKGLLSELTTKKEVVSKGLKIKQVSRESDEKMTRVTLTINGISDNLYGAPDIQLLDKKAQPVSDTSISYLWDERKDDICRVLLEYPKDKAAHYVISYYGYAAYDTQQLTLKNVPLRK